MPQNPSLKTRTGGRRSAALKAAFPLTIPVLAGYVFTGITYGLLMVSSGFPIWLSTLNALIIYTGSLEFLLVAMLLSAFNPVSALVTALMVGSRHIFYGISMLGRYRNVGRKKFYLIYATTDETFAVNYSAQIPAGIDRGWFYFWVSLLDQAYWTVGATVGSVCGSFVTFDTRGLDFVLTTMFMVIFVNQWLVDSDAARKVNIYGFLRSHISEIVGVASSLACLAIFGPDDFIVPSLALILIVLTIFRSRIAATLPSHVVRPADETHATDDEDGTGRALAAGQGTAELAKEGSR
ncbi:MAG: AzlC family ABC transporter permease [Bifidobacteriaceae bacterium]|nr:AzlC family ABC transporter permease [Bifidobacteriaceae bacterium]